MAQLAKHPSPKPTNVKVFDSDRPAGPLDMLKYGYTEARFIAWQQGHKPGPMFRGKTLIPQGKPK